MGEVDILEGHVGSEDEVVPPLDRHQRGIVANPQFHSFFKS
jgi:hypothetical protein